MPKQNSKTPATDAMKALANFLYKPDQDDNIQVVEARLKEAGIDTKKVLELARQQLNQAKNRKNLEAARQRRTELLAQIQQVRQDIATGSSNTLANVKQFIEANFGKTPEAAVLYRKFENTSPEDLESLLEDTLFLDQLKSESRGGQQT